LAARGRLDEEEPQLGDGPRLLDDEHRADVLSAALGDPAAFVLRIKIADEPRGDFRHQGLERHVPGVLLRVERAVARNNPSDVTRRGRTQPIRGWRGARGRQRRFDRVHRLYKPGLVGRGERREQLADLLP